MTPKEKAKELVNTYRYILSIPNAPLGENKDSIAKQCALIAVDEIIQSLRHAEAISDLGYPGYWHKVKIEINKL